MQFKLLGHWQTAPSTSLGGLAGGRALARMCGILAVGLLVSACGSAAPPVSPASSAASPSASNSVAAAASALAKPGSSAAPSSSVATKPAASGLVKLNAAYTAVGVTSAAPSIAKGAGYFAEQGLDIELPFMSPTTLTAGLISGSVEAGTGSPASVAAAAAQGADLVMIGALYQGSTFSIVARPDVKTVADLKGKKVGATQRGATTDFVIRKVSLQQGFSNDVNVVYIPENAQIVAGIVSGALDAGVLSEPFTSVAINQGNHAVWGPDTPGAGDFVSMSNIIAKKTYVASHKDVMTRFLKANIEANHLTKAHPEQSVPYVQKLVQMDDAKVVRQAIDGVQSVLREDLSFDLSAVQSVIDSAATSAPDVAKVKPQDIADLSLVNDIKASGFINTLK